MRRFVGRDGEIYMVRDLRELVARLHATAFAKELTDELFMRNMAGRVEMFTGQPCRFDTVESFVEDLISLGVITEKNC